MFDVINVVLEVFYWLSNLIVPKTLWGSSQLLKVTDQIPFHSQAHSSWLKGNNAGRREHVYYLPCGYLMHIIIINGNVEVPTQSTDFLKENSLE